MFQRVQNKIDLLASNVWRNWGASHFGKKASLLAAGLFLLVMAAGADARSAEDFDSDESRFSMVKAPPNKARHRLYPGGRDEEELQVQVSLPMPSRNPDGLTQSVADPAAAGPVDRD
jgi:hypothetical protein